MKASKSYIRGALAEVRRAQAALSQPATLPADVARAKSALQHAVVLLQSHLHSHIDTERILNLLAGYLPDDYEVELHIERGAGWVMLYDAEGEGGHVDADTETIGARLLRALAQARRDARKG